MDQGSQEFIAGQLVAVLSSVADDGTPRACSIFYILDPAIPALIFKSRLQSDHIVSLRSRPFAAMAIYRHDSGYSRKAGIQLTGTVERVSTAAEMTRYVNQYSERLPGADEHFEPIERLLENDVEATLWRFNISEYKFTDNWSGRLDLTYSDVKQR